MLIFLVDAFISVAAALFHPHHALLPVAIMCQLLHILSYLIHLFNPSTLPYLSLFYFWMLSYSIRCSEDFFFFHSLLNLWNLTNAVSSSIPSVHNYEWWMQQ
jgi:hypothetical protein